MSRQVVNAGFVLPPIDQRGNPPALDKLPPVNDNPPELDTTLERPPDEFLRRPNPPGAPEEVARVVSAEDVLNVIQPLVGLTENPPGSNKTLIGQWYGFDGVPWCAETVSYGLYNGGFNDGEGHITLAGPTTETSRRGSWSDGMSNILVKRRPARAPRSTLGRRGPGNAARGV